MTDKRSRKTWLTIKTEGIPQMRWAPTWMLYFKLESRGHRRRVVKALDGALEARELIKITVLKNCFDDIHALTGDHFFPDSL